ncbi:2-nitropropane dioxygenase, partial [Rhodococcus opacus M213]
VLASGQVVGLLDDLPTCKDLIDGIIADAIKRIDALGALRA